MNCPIANCPAQVTHPRSICKAHKRLLPRPLLDALAYYGKKRNGGRQHQVVFERAVESINKVMQWGRSTVAADKPAALPYRDD